MGCGCSARRAQGAYRCKRLSPTLGGPMTDAAPVELLHVGHRFGDVVAIADVSMAVPAGSLTAIIGPSGAGKTTTIRTITGALAPTTGEVRVLGEEPRRFRRATRERIGYMPQLFVLYPELTVAENVDFVASLFGLLGRRRRARCRAVLELVELWDARGRRADQLSGGMRRRLELACALVHEPSLLVLDEPTTGIDPLLRTRVWQKLDELRKTGVTILLTTQYVGEAEYCDYVALISSGRVLAYAAPSELRRRALGGDVIQVITRKPLDARALGPIEGVVEIRPTGANELLVIVDHAGHVSPRLLSAIDDAGAEVEYSREYLPSFDEVFTTLVAGHNDGVNPPANGNG
jgi:ABC-2 type transport system ATP-binding protein